MTKRSGILLPANLIAAWLMLASACKVLAVDPVVANVQAKQREGSRLVDITYDVADPDSPTLTVYLKVSPDGGKTWKGPIELVSGDVGRGVLPGVGKRIVWDAGKELSNQFGLKYRYKIGASDQWLVPDGMALIPAGPFRMGYEGYIVSTVTVSAFAVDKWEVSIEQWEKVRAWGNAHGYDLVVGGSSGHKHPVHSVNWYDVVKWNNARSEKEGKVPAYYEDTAKGVVYRQGEKYPDGVRWDAGYRLPTEAEWEKAARGGVDGKLFPWGTDQISPQLANYYEDYTGKPMPIGSYGAYGYGLYDMVGNVGEWCWDWWKWYDSYSTEQPTQPDPRGPRFGSQKIIRGVGWGNNVLICTVGSKWSAGPNDRGPRFGFRCVLPAGQP